VSLGAGSEAPGADAESICVGSDRTVARCRLPRGRVLTVVRLDSLRAVESERGDTAVFGAAVPLWPCAVSGVGVAELVLLESTVLGLAAAALPDSGAPEVMPVSVRALVARVRSVRS
jgi:hypothetical protein